MTDFTQDLFARRRNASDGNTRVVSVGKLWYDSITNSIRVSDGHTPGGQIVTGQSGSYTLPTATPSVKGGVQLGANIIATGASIDVLQPTKVSQLENDSNYLSGAVLTGYATETFVTTQGYVTSSALASGNANVIAANTRIQSISANLGAYQIWANANVTTLTSNAGAQATSINRLDANIGAFQTYANLHFSDTSYGNTEVTALLAGTITTGPLTASQLTVDSLTGGYFANISGAAHASYGRQSWRFFSQQNPSGGPGSWILFPDGSTQTTAYPGTSTTLSTFDANLGTATTDISNLVTQANANTAAYLTTHTGNISANNISVTGNVGIGGRTNQYNIQIGGKALTVTAPTGATAYLEAIGGEGSSGGVNIGNASVRHALIDTNSDRTLKFWVNRTGAFGNAVTTALSIDRNLSATFANDIAIGGNVSSTGNVIVGINITPNYYNSAGAGKGLDIVSTFASKVGYLNLVGGSGSSGLLTFGNTAGIQAVVTTGTDNSLTFATKNPTTGANVASTALTLYSDQTARLSGNLTVGQSNGNILITNGYISGTYTPTSATGSAIQVTGKDTQGGTGWFDFLKATNITSGATNPNKTFRLNSTGFIEIINSAYTATIFSLSDAGSMSVNGNIQISGKQAVNGPAFSAYANNTLQTITSGSQQKVLFQVEEFDTDGCYANSRFTPTVEGYYQLNAEVRLDGSSSTGEIMIVLYKNTTEYKRGTNQSGTSIATNFWAMQVSTLVYANGTTDYFEIKVQQTSGGNVTVTAVNNPAITWFNGAMVRGA